MTDTTDEPTQHYPIESVDQVEVGDTVFEVIRWGHREHETKLKPVRVIGVVRSACRVESPSRPLPITIPFGKLRCTKPPIPSKNRRPLAPSENRSHAEDDAFRAWLDMGQGLLTDLDHERELLELERDEVSREASAAVQSARERVEDMEAQLRTARQEMERLREEGKARVVEIAAQIREVGERKSRIAATLSAAAPKTTQKEERQAS